MAAAFPDPLEDLAAAVDEVFLGYWPDDLMDLVRAPYLPGAIQGYAHRDGGMHLLQGGGE